MCVLENQSCRDVAIWCSNSEGDELLSADEVHPPGPSSQKLHVSYCIFVSNSAY